MAKTDNPDIFLVKPSWVKRVLDGKARTVWYLKMLDKHDVVSLTHSGNLIYHTTNEGRRVTIQAVDDVTPGCVYKVDGITVTVADKNVNHATHTGPSKTEINSRIHADAHDAGMKAGEACNPTPMIVFERHNPFDDKSPIVNTWEPIASGVCGFAWINIRPGTCSFARWASKQPSLMGAGTLAHKSYYGGVDIWVPFFDQSLEKKSAYASAYAKILNENNIQARSMSRMD